MTLCRRCPAEILFCKQNPTARNPNPQPNPLDVRPDPNGNLRLDTISMRYDVLTGDALKEARANNEDLFISHFVTCPARQHFKKEKKA